MTSCHNVTGVRFLTHGVDRFTLAAFIQVIPVLLLVGWLMKTMLKRSLKIKDVKNSPPPKIIPSEAHNVNYQKMPIPQPKPSYI